MDQTARHFLDLISPTLKKKLSRHGLMSQDRQSLIDKLRPPEEIRLRLPPLNGLCTYKLLDRLRYGECERIDWDGDRVAGGIGEWFGELRETTSEWGYRPQDRDETLCDSLAGGGMLSHQWSCMGEALLALDKATRVPNDTPDTRRIFQAVRSIPEWVVREIHKLYPDMRVEIMAMGSYPCGARVGDIDEFDFLLICDPDLGSDEPENQLKVWWDRLYHELPDLVLNKLYPLSRLGVKFSDLGDGSLLYTPETCITSVFRHGPAQCVEIGWR